jgi:hypothetical protein
MEQMKKVFLFETFFDVHSSQNVIHAIFKNLFLGTLLGLIIYIIQLPTCMFGFNGIIGFIIAGNGLMFARWGVEILWSSIVSKMVENPYSWFAFLTKIPFWYLAGGIGYTLSILISKRIGLIEFYDIPINPFFHTGGKILVVVQIVFQIIIFIMWTASSILSNKKNSG